MEGYRHYIPILKSKQGELEAIRELSPVAKQSITPLVEIIPVPWDFDKNLPKVPLKQHFDKSISKVKKCFGSEYTFFIDLGLVKMSEPIFGLHPLEYFLRELLLNELNFVPTIDLYQNEACLQAVANMVNHNGKGLCIRIKKEDVNDLLELQTNLDTLLNNLSLHPHDCHVIIDYDILPNELSVQFIDDIVDVIEFFPYVEEWQTFTFAASSFPLVLEVDKDDSKYLPRNEFILWLAILDKKTTLPRLPSFGDYAIQHPELSDLDFRYIKSSVNLRYAVEKAWLVYKGREKVRHGYDQFNSLCRLLIMRKEYSGEDYSWGDGYIKRCADNDDGPGNASTWRKVGFSHHMTLTAEQVVTV